MLSLDYEGAHLRTDQVEVYGWILLDFNVQMWLETAVLWANI